jgi:hypothetical protein
MGDEQLISIKLVEGGKPVIKFSGDWATKDMQLALRLLPRSFRDYQYDRRKNGVGKFTSEEVNNVNA